MAGRFLDLKPVHQEDGIPRDALLNDLAAFEAHIKGGKNWRGELWTFNGTVHNAPRSENGSRFFTLVIPEDASLDGALADVAAIRARVSALPAGCGVL